MEELAVFTVIETCNVPRQEGAQLTDNTTELLLLFERSVFSKFMGGDVI